MHSLINTGQKWKRTASRFMITQQTNKKSCARVSNKPKKKQFSFRTQLRRALKALRITILQLGTFDCNLLSLLISSLPVS